MNAIVSFFVYILARCALVFRYRLHIKGLETLTEKNLPKKGGILFLANHPAEIDPCILTSVLWRSFHPHPLALEIFFRKPFIGFILKLVGAFPIPNFGGSSNSFKQKQIESIYQKLNEALDNKENLLVYPSGGLTLDGKENIGGNSGVHHILEMCPEANVVLIKTNGLFGSRFSKAFTGKTPDLGKTFWECFKIILKNFIFFVPRRHVTIEMTPAPSDFPFKASRKELNSYLEQFYNSQGPEPLTLISYSFWKQDIPPITARQVEKKSVSGTVPQVIEQKIKEELSRITQLPPSVLKEDMNLAKDLGLDSLDVAQLNVFLKDTFGVSHIPSSELQTIGDLMAFAARLKSADKEEVEESTKEAWEGEVDRPHPQVPLGSTLHESFFKMCDLMKDHVACVDLISGKASYQRLKLVILLLASSIKKLSGKHIGIMMPASIAGNVLVLATLLSGKVPVMINWTLGPRNLKSVKEQSEIEVVLTAWSFLDRLDNVDLSGIDDCFVLIEDLRSQFKLTDKLKALFLSRLKSHQLLKYFPKVVGEDRAVILFTSGTESYPKGVPLTHANILSNLTDGFKYINLQKEDILLGSLPPFHSFGFSVTGLFPLIIGLRVVYSPNPTDGRRLVAAIERWKVTLICFAPTFIKNILRVASKESLQSLKLAVLGAEKASKDIYDRLLQLNPSCSILEGYGITECSPILTLNPLGKPTKGVGKPLLSVELLIVDPETHEILPNNQEGLILARGLNVFKGYLDPHLPSPFIELQGKQWYITGDLGSLDEQGYLQLSGRLKRFVKIGGEMISLGAIEEILQEIGTELHWSLNPDTPTFAVCALEEKGKKGEIHLFTTLSLSLDEVNKLLKDKGLSNLARLTSIQTVDYIPLLGTGKTDYRALTAKLMKND